jgi:hypothetical protein
MTMDREKAPGEGHEPEFVSDVPDDAREYRTEGWGPVHYLFIALALLMLLAGALWLGTLFGLIAGVLPGGRRRVGHPRPARPPDSALRHRPPAPRPPLTGHRRTPVPR